MRKYSECTPKPLLLETNGSESDSWRNIWHYQSLKQLKYEMEGPVHIAIRNQTSTPGQSFGEELIALGALCSGLRETPLRPRRM
jgi:hypothetical protein